MRRILWLGTAAFFIGISGASAEDLLVQRPGGNGWQLYSVPGVRNSDRMSVGDSIRGSDGTSSTGLYGRNGERVGTVQTQPYGGATVYDKKGARVWR